MTKRIPGADKENKDDIEAIIAEQVKKAPLIIVAAVICGIAAIGMIGLSFRHRNNYVWLENRLYVPGMANSLAGILSTLIGVYTQQDGEWSNTALITAGVIGANFCVCGGMWFLIEIGPLRSIRKRHGRHYEGWVDPEGKGEAKQGVNVETKAVV